MSASRRDWGGRIVGIGSNRLRQGIGVLACGVAFGGLAGHAAAQGQPAPEPSRPPARAPIRPDPAPGARAPVVGSTTVVVTTRSTPTPVTSTPSVSARTGALRPAQAVKKQTPTRRTTTPSAPRGDGRPLRSLTSWASRGELFATSAATQSSGTSFLLLFVGLALVLLTIGETTFLRRAARASKPPRGTDEERLAIHRVQLKR